MKIKNTLSDKSRIKNKITDGNNERHLFDPCTIVNAIFKLFVKQIYVCKSISNTNEFHSSNIYIYIYNLQQ